MFGQTQLIAMGIGAVAVFGAGYQVSSWISDSKILSLQTDIAALEGEKKLANAAAETRRNELAKHAKKSQEIADAAIESLRNFATKPPIVSERIKRVRIPVVGVCKPPESRDSRGGEDRNQPPPVGNTDSAPTLPAGGYIRVDQYRTVKAAYDEKLAEYKLEHKKHAELSTLVQSLHCVRIVD